MAVISMMRISGDANELAAKIREHVRPVGDRLAPQHGGLGTILARTDDGILAINLWKEEAGRHAMAEEPDVQQAVAAAGLPQPHFEAYEILDWKILPEAVQASGG